MDEKYPNGEKYLVNYYETYTNSYEIEADSKEEAEEKLILEILSPLLPILTL